MNIIKIWLILTICLFFYSFSYLIEIDKCQEITFLWFYLKSCNGIAIRRVNKRISKSDIKKYLKRWMRRKLWRSRIIFLLFIFLIIYFIQNKRELGDNLLFFISVNSIRAMKINTDLEGESKLNYENEFVKICKIEKDRKIKYLLEYKAGHKVLLDAEDKELIDYEIGRLVLSRSLENKKLIKQKEVGKGFGISRQMVNYKANRLEKEGFKGMVREVGRPGVMSEEVLPVIIDKIVNDWSKNYEQISRELIEEEVIDYINPAIIRYGVKQVDLNLVRKKMHSIIGRGDYGKKISGIFLMEKLTKMVEDLLNIIGEKDRLAGIKEQYFQLLPLIQKRREYLLHKDKKSKKHLKRVSKPFKIPYLEKLKNLRIRRLKELFCAEVSHQRSGDVLCNICDQKARYKGKRLRFYRDEEGKSRLGFTRLYRCMNENCKEKYFSIPPDGVFLYSRVTNKVYELALRCCFQIDGTFRKVSSFITSILKLKKELSAMNIWNWFQKIGALYIPIHEIFGIKWSGYMGVDEKWIRIFGEWYYVYMAIDTYTWDLLHIEVFESNGYYFSKTFLMELKKIGYKPKVIITDMWNSYPLAIKEVFPDAIHKECIFHIKEKLKKLFKDLTEELDEKEQENYEIKKLKKAVYKLFKADNTNKAKRRYGKTEKFKKKLKENKIFDDLFKFIDVHYNKFLSTLNDPDIPRTNNTLERIIREFNTRYRLTTGFENYYCVKNYLNLFMIYYRFRKFDAGCFKGLCPLEVAGFDIKGKDWIDYALAI